MTIAIVVGLARTSHCQSGRHLVQWQCKGVLLLLLLLLLFVLLWFSRVLLARQSLSFDYGNNKVRRLGSTDHSGADDGTGWVREVTGCRSRLEENYP